MDTLRTQLQKVAPGITQKAIDELPKLTADQLDEMAKEGNTVLIETITFDESLNFPELPGSWKMAYVGARTKGSHGTLVLLPDAKWTRKLWTEGQIKIGMAAGLTEAQASIWANTKIAHRHDLLPKLVEVLNNQDLLTKYLSYDSKNVDKWMARTKIKDGLNPYRRKSLVAMLQEQLEPPKPVPAPKKAKKPKAEKPAEETPVEVDDQRTADAEALEAADNLAVATEQASA